MPPQNIPPAEDVEPASSFDFRSVYYTLIEKLWVVILCVGAAAFLTFGYIKRAPRIYSATVKLQVAQDKVNILNAADLQPEDLRSPETLKTIEKLLQGRALFERVLQTNKLADDPRFVDVSTGSQPSKEQLVSRLERMVTVSLQAGTRLISVRVEHTDRALTEQIANSLVNEFALQEQELHASSTQGGMRFLMEQAQSLREQLHAATAALQAYRATNSISLGEDQNNSVNQKLNDIDSSLTEAESRRRNLESQLEQAQREKGNVEGLLGISAIATDPSVVELNRKIVDQEIKFALLKQTKLPKHPKYIQAQSELNELQGARSNATLAAAQTLQSAFETAQANEKELQKAYKLQEAQVQELKRQRARDDELSGEVARIKDFYETVAKRLNETTISEGWEQNKVRVVEPAYVPDRPVKPDRKRILMMGLMVGLMVGLGLAMGLEALDSSLRTPEQAETFLNLPLLTAIPQISSVQAGRKQLIMADDVECYGAEAFRTLRTNLAMLGPEGTRRTFLFTSALPEEGKTFCALNYAWSLAQQGLRTLLIEGDLRCPAVESALPGAPLGQSPGVTDYLRDQAGFGAIVQGTELANFSYIPAGTRTTNPAELLAQEGFAGLLHEALLHFDRVVVDSAPIQPVSDALLLVNRVETVCVIVRANKTPRKAIQRAIQILQTAGAPLAGILFNGWTVTRGQHYYDYSYYPQYGRQMAGKT